MEGKAQRESYKRIRERYMLIHKRPVGPKTADTLSFFFNKLSYSEQSSSRYIAGWSATEAGLVGTDKSIEWRNAQILEGQSCWQLARESEMEHAINVAENRGTAISTLQVNRFGVALALSPVLAQIPGENIDKETLRSSYADLLSIAEGNLHDLHDPTQSKHASNLRSFAFEIGSLLACNRLLSRRLIAIPAFARSDDGNRYPSETHDIQILSLDRGDIEKIIPIEVKSTLIDRYFERYDAALIGGHHDLLLDDELSIDDFVTLLRREFDGDANSYEIAYLEQTTDSIIHTIRHYSRASEFGRHCTAAACQIPHSRHDTYAVA